MEITKYVIDLLKELLESYLLLDTSSFPIKRHLIMLTGIYYKRKIKSRSECLNNYLLLELSVPGTKEPE